MSCHSSSSSSEEEYDSDEPPQLELDLQKLMDSATLALKTPCHGVKRLTRGSNHEIFVLSFDISETAPESLRRAGFSCIARAAREAGQTARDESEIVSARYVRRHTKIPVPEIYHYDLDPDNDVGAPYSLMERLPGKHLYKIWDALSLDHKKVALSQIANVIVQLAGLKFDKIGSLFESGIGPVVHPCHRRREGPFSTTLDYLRSFASTDGIASPDLKRVLLEVQAELGRFFASTDDAVYLQPPFAFVHADLDGQNILFVPSEDGSGPVLSGLIDFENAYTGPLEFLYKYPIFIQDVCWSEHLYAENKILRAHFVRAVHDILAETEAQRTFIDCMNSKSYALNRFREAFMLIICTEEVQQELAEEYVETMRDWTGLAYNGTVDYVPELYTDAGDPAPPRLEEDSG